MKLIIDVPHSLYANLSTIKHESVAGKRILECVKNGTPLQHNSIKYIDRDEAVEAIQKKAKRIKNLDTINGLCGAISILYELPVNHVKGKESEDKE
jgi:hypothetical protein